MSPARVPVPDDIAETFPSVSWDERQWLLAFTVVPDLADRILDGIAAASTQWRKSTPKQKLGACRGDYRIYYENDCADHRLGIAATP